MREEIIAVFKAVKHKTSCVDRAAPHTTVLNRYRSYQFQGFRVNVAY